MNQYNFYPGQKVVCVAGRIRLQTGATYVIDTISECRCCANVRLVGVGNSQGKTGSYCGDCGFRWPREAWFKADRFRPFDELDACIEEIEKMQAPVELETVAA